MVMLVLRIIGHREKFLDGLFGPTLGNQAVLEERNLRLAQLEEVAVSALVALRAGITSVPLLRTSRPFKCLDHGILLDVVVLF